MFAIVVCVVFLGICGLVVTLSAARAPHEPVLPCVKLNGCANTGSPYFKAHARVAQTPF